MAAKSVSTSTSMLLQTTCKAALRSGSRRVRHRQYYRGVASVAAAVQELPVADYAATPPPSLLQNHTRRETIKTAKPFSDFLTDTFRRQHDYLRISITEKCNLRCLYCMPEEGVPQSPQPALLTTPEIFLLSSVFVSQGVRKIRLTGGEPTVRHDILPLMHQIGSLQSQGLRELCLTTNGISLHRKLDSMVQSGLTGVNLSLDTLDPWQFQIMTRRKGFDAVIKSIDRILEMNHLGAGIKLKINCVVMRGMNEREIVPFVELGREKDLEVRFIEYMPFDGNKWSKGKMLGYMEMLEMIRIKYPGLRKVQDHKNDTSKTYEIPGFAGRIGFITSMTHNFCGTCNRLRITSDGNLKVCLFGNSEVSLRDILRKSNNGKPIDEQAFEAMKEIEMNRRQSLPTTQEIRGISEHEQELLDVIGVAVKRKKEKHAGMGELENMKNRPMILIDDQNPRSCPKPVSSLAINHSEISTRRLQGWRSIPLYVLPHNNCSPTGRLFSTGRKVCSVEAVLRKALSNQVDTTPPTLTHLTSSGNAHMVPISSKNITQRTATAVCSVYFSNPTAQVLIRENRSKKGDVLGVARIAGIMAAKRTADLVPLCHPIVITHVAVDVEIPHHDEPSKNAQEAFQLEVGRSSIPGAGTGQGDAYTWAPNSNYTSGGNNSLPQQMQPARVDIKATVSCDGKTGVEMEALTAASVAALTVYDMCKAVDKGMRIEGLRVISKHGGKSGTWIEGISA